MNLKKINNDEAEDDKIDNDKDQLFISHQFIWSGASTTPL